MAQHPLFRPATGLGGSSQRSAATPGPTKFHRITKANWARRDIDYGIEGISAVGHHVLQSVYF